MFLAVVPVSDAAAASRRWHLNNISRNIFAGFWLPLKTVRLKLKQTDLCLKNCSRSTAGWKNIWPRRIRTIDLPIPYHNHCQLVYHALIVPLLQPILYSQQALLQSENNRDHSKMKNESVEKSLEKWMNILEERRKMVKQKMCLKRPKRLQ